MTDRVHIKDRTLLSERWGTLSEYEIAYRDQDGRTQNLRREVYGHGPAAAVLLFDEERDRVVLVRQFRLPPHLSGDDGFLLEACAGLLDGEDAETAIRREAEEETGINPLELTALGAIYPSPGSLNEKLFLFLGAYRGPIVQARGGLAEEGEDIEVVELPLAGALAMIETGEIVDAKTVVLLQRLALKRAKTAS